MKCQKCGFEVSQGELFCGNCGAKIISDAEEIKLCKNCGAKMNPSEKFCGECGHSADETAISYEPKSKKRNSSLLIICISIIAVLIIALSAVLIYVFVKRQDSDEESNNISMSERIEEANKIEKDESASDIPKASLPENVDLPESESKENTEIAEDIEIEKPDPDNDIDKEDSADILAETPNDSLAFDDYLFPSDKEYISIEYLSSLTKGEVGLIRNEIYARHGYVFKTEEYANYFNSKAWYHADPNYDVSSLNEIEQTNINTILAYEKQMGWR